MKPRVVFDCMVFLQGAGRPEGPAGACLRLVDAEQITLYVSTAILAEVRDVLTRPKTQRRFPSLSSEWVESFVHNVASKAVTLSEVPRVFPLERDPKDEPYLNLALVAQARYLISRDTDLLDLMHDAGFRQKFPALTIVGPPAFLQAIARASQAVLGTAPEQPSGPETSEPS